MEPKHKALPVGFRFRPTDCEISKYFLTRKALEQRMRGPNVPEECNDIFSRRPRDLPGKFSPILNLNFCFKINQIFNLGFVFHCPDLAYRLMN